MAFLTAVAVRPGPTRRVDVTVRVTRFVLFVAVALTMLAVAAALHAIDRETAAAWFTGLGEALLFGTIGLVAGEKLGAREAESRISQ
jgi:hypothetical protein